MIDEFGVLQREFRGLLGRKVWSVKGGPLSGSMFTLEIGDRIPQEVPVQNDALTEEERNYRGEYCLFVQDAAWRIENALDGEVLGTWMDDSRLGGPLLNSLNQLLHRTVESVEIVKGTLDCTIGFDTGKILRLFCISSLTFGPDFMLGHISEWSAVGPHGKIELGAA